MRRLDEEKISSLDQMDEQLQQDYYYYHLVLVEYEVWFWNHFADYSERFVVEKLVHPVEIGVGDGDLSVAVVFSFLTVLWWCEIRQELLER